jgi:hypothetical protein
MNIKDIAKVKVDWMEQFGNDPQLKFVLKYGCDLQPNDSFRFHQSGNIFYAESENEVRFYRHDRGDHNGFGGSKFKLHMADDWDASQWHDCSNHERVWMGGGAMRLAECNLNGRILSIFGPWSSSAVMVEPFIGPCMDVRVLPAKYRDSLRNPAYFLRQRKRLGPKASEGLYLQCHLTVAFVRETLDRLAPWLDLYEGDYGWYPIMRDMEPKNPRKGRRYPLHENMSAEQNLILGR